ncbi:unnamed protein product [Polarella glacialis]|uniref:Uncharacterized protein n=1 Tax=Polarella glacialis TaxID=89957 RepID=A0A813FJJ6_POLGL|nr:unnamed protein product [Polarella glacialis]
MSLAGPSSAICDTNNLQSSDTSVGACHYERFIKGSSTAGVATVFKSFVPEAYRDVHVQVNRLFASAESSSTALASETSYQILCFAEDDWLIQANSLAILDRSPSYAAPFGPNKVSLTAASTLRTAIGTKTTLDQTPPTFTQLAISDPTAANNQIVVTFALNEPGTAYCRATRHDSGETSGDVPLNRILAARWSVNRILSASWSGVYSSSDVTITMTKLENIDPALTNRDDQNVPFYATLYDVYCWAKVDTAGDARPNYMTQVGADVAVWVADTTAPTLIYVSSKSEAVKDEGALQVWCQALELSSASSTVCKDGELQSASGFGVACHIEAYLKGASAQSTVFRADVHAAYTDYDIEVNRLYGKDYASQESLVRETGYNVFCFAEDDWRIESDAASNSPNYVNAGGPNRVVLAAVQAFGTAVGTKTTLDLTPPTVTLTGAVMTETSITVTLTLDEIGTAWCNAVRKDYSVPAVLEILETNFHSGAMAAGSPANVVITAYDAAGNPLQRGTDYDVYCYAEDDLCSGCRAANGISAASVAGTKYAVRTLESIAFDKIHLTLQAKLWCAAWTTDPASMSTNYESLIKAEVATCEDSRGNQCGSVWVYDLDDLEDSTTTQANYDSSTAWRYNEDVEIILTGLIGQTAYPFIYCYAEDDETDGAGSAPNKMTYNTGAVEGSKILAIKDAIVSVTTLDETPPTFTQLEIQDPTAANNQIVVTFALNEAGTTYCRATRRDSGETSGDMPINRILSAGWSASYAGTGTATITMSKLENVSPGLTYRDDVDTPIVEAIQYDVYCFALDAARNTQGNARQNYMTQDYVGTAVNAAATPLGGATSAVYILDSTPPSVIFVAKESVGHETLQVTLQLNEPGTVWCAAVEQASAGVTAFCRQDELQGASSGTDCYYETFIKGDVAHGTTFRADVHEAYRDVDIEVNRIFQKDLAGSVALSHEYGYNVFCFAEDDWKLQADNALAHSVSYSPASAPNPMTFSAAGTLQVAIGVMTTLDQTAPEFTQLEIGDPTTANNQIVVTFALNEAGTTYCRATRTDSGETSADMPINRILSAGWSASYAGSGTATIQMSKLENGALDAGDNAVLSEQTQYDVFCWAEDSAVDGLGLARPNYMTQDYLGTAVGAAGAPVGGTTRFVWMVDVTPPTMTLVRREAVARATPTLQVTLQLDEPGTIWCQAAELSSSSVTTYCKDGDLQDTNNANPCYYEDFIKGSSSDSTIFRADVHTAYRDVDIEVNKIWEKDGSGSADLTAEYGYNIFCFAEDEWKIEAAGASHSVSYVVPAEPMKTLLFAVTTLATGIGTQTTLDVTPPSFTKLEIADPTATNTNLKVTFALNEPGTAYCRATRSDSGESAADMSVNRIITASWSGVYSSSDVTIDMSKLENVNPALTIRDDQDVPFAEQTLYDVYCWAQDSAVDSNAMSRPNYMLHDYVATDVGSASVPLGGKTANVWILDSSPPTMIYVRAEAISGTTLQVTLQLDEPGTIWCQAAELSSSSVTTYCKDGDLQDTNNANPCYYEDFIKGSSSDSTVFRADVHTAYRNVDIEVNRIWEKDGSGSADLTAEYGYNIFCFAEDDWKIQAAAASHSVSYVVPAEPMKTMLSAVTTLATGIGTQTTLDVTPPSFTKLEIADPTATNTNLKVTFALNEPGTAYCRATRSDSGESAADMSVNRIITASWSGVYSSSDVTIDMSKLENVNPALTIRDDQDVPFAEQTLYDIYCWAQDSAVDSNALSRPNYMLHDFVATDVGSASVPLGGKTANVWIVDSTPPTMIYVSAEAISGTTLQVTLQLDEPGTIWCQAVEVTGSSVATNCLEADIQDGDPTIANCPYEVYVKGATALSPADAVFRQDVHEGFKDYDVEINRILSKDSTASNVLTHQHPYRIFCFAEDDWVLQAEAVLLASRSPSYAAPSAPNHAALAAGTALMTAIGTLTTLDEAAPEFTALAVVDPTAANDRIVVTFTLNEAGTAYCRATRRDSGETHADMTINRILTAGWFATQDGSSTSATLTILKLQDLALAADEIPIAEATQYDVYCWAKDNAVATNGLARPNYMTQDYVGTAVGSTASPAGGTTAAVWVADATAPTMLFVRAEAVKTESTLQVTLQLNEPGTVWCQAAEPSSGTGTTYCREDQIQEAASGTDCYWETFAKGSVAHGTAFRTDVHLAYVDVDVEVNKIWQRDMAAGVALDPETGYKVFCFAEDDWVIEASNAATQSLSFSAPALPNRVLLAAGGSTFKDSIGPQTTLDLTPPTITMQSIVATEVDISVRKNLAIPTSLEIFDTGFRTSGLFTPPASAVATITAYDADGTPLQRGTDYEARMGKVYCYAEDDLCAGCRAPAGTNSAAVAATVTQTRFVGVRSVAHDKLQLTLQVDEGARIWCAAWPTASPPLDGLGGALGATNYEALIKARATASAASCQDVHGNACGSGFWVYDLDDLEDGSVNQATYDAAATWRYNEDVEILLGGLIAETEYSYIYCYAEDDETDGAGSAPNKMTYNTGSVEASKVLTIKAAFGALYTLDETPPTFTKLQIEDPTAAKDRIVVTFTLNEVTRSDSGEVATDMAINRILTAGWSAAHDGSASTATIEITKLENLDPSLTNRDDQDVPIAEATQYDVYCWAQDDAIDTAGLPRANYMTATYVGTDVANPLSPSGGRTASVWVLDATAPQMIFVSAAESTSQETLQVTLQLNEPGTIWCQPGVQDASAVTDCFWTSFIKGNNFRADVHEAYVDYRIDMNMLYPTGANAAVALQHQTGHEIFCFAEDDWKIQADNAASLSVNYAPASAPNPVDYAAVNTLRSAIGTQTTLDDTPPAFTQLSIQDPTASNSQIVVTFKLNEPGTAYCRVTRSDSGETAADMSINRILTASWSAIHDGSSSTATLAISNLENVNFALTNRDDEVAVISEATQYDVYCLAKDNALDSHGVARPNYMTQDYIGTAVGTTSSPYTSHVWVTDATAPTMIFVDARAMGAETLRAAGYCHYETFVKGTSGTATVFRADVHEAYRDVQVEVNRILRSSQTQSYALQHVTLAAATTFKASVATQITLDKSPPSFTKLNIQDPTAAKDRIIVTFKLNEAGTAYCRVARTDSGETSGAMSINRILTAGWSAANSGSATSTIEITTLENVDPTLTNRDDEVALIAEATQYDVYCWAMDDATDSKGLLQPNYMTEDYLRTNVALVDSPLGGRSPGVWVVDTTPPTMVFVATEGISSGTLQVTLQLNEPGTVSWLSVGLLFDLSCS